MDPLLFQTEHYSEKQGDTSMIIGIPKEIKIHEYRIGMTPPSVRELTSRITSYNVCYTKLLRFRCNR